MLHHPNCSRIGSRDIALGDSFQQFKEQATQQKRKQIKQNVDCVFLLFWFCLFVLVTGILFIAPSFFDFVDKELECRTGWLICPKTYNKYVRQEGQEPQSFGLYYMGPIKLLSPFLLCLVVKSLSFPL